MDSDPGSTVAMLAFTLSELPNDTTRRMMLREMWNTGADTMVGLGSTLSDSPLPLDPDMTDVRRVR